MKKTITILLALAMILVMIPSFASAADTVTKGVSFHCNDAASDGNGRVWPVNAYPNGENNSITPELDLERVDSTVFALISKEYECPACGSVDWITFSNKKGDLTGNNVQLYHPGTTPPPVVESGIIATDYVTLTTYTEKILNVWQKEVTPYEEWTQYISEAYSSVTATYADYKDKIIIDPKNGKVTVKTGEKVIVPNSNHFTYAAIDPEELITGVDLALVVGNKLDKVGEASVKINADGKLELTVDGAWKSTFGFVAFNDSFTIPKNGNIHSDKLFGGHGSNYTTVLPAAGKDGKIYIYIHFESLQLKIGAPVLTKEWTEEGENFLREDKSKSRTDSATEQLFGITYAIYDGADDVTAKALALDPGFYNVVFFDPYKECDCTDACDETCKYVEFNVEVVAGVDTEVNYEAAYTVNAAPVVKNVYLRDIVNDVVIINKTAVKK